MYADMNEFVSDMFAHLYEVFAEYVGFELAAANNISNWQDVAFSHETVRAVFVQMCIVANQPVKLVDLTWSGEEPAKEAVDFLATLVMNMQGKSSGEMKQSKACNMRASLLFGQMLAGLGGRNLLKASWAHRLNSWFLMKLAGS